MVQHPREELILVLFVRLAKLLTRTQFKESVMIVVEDNFLMKNQLCVRTVPQENTVPHLVMLYAQTVRQITSLENGLHLVNPVLVVKCFTSMVQLLMMECLRDTSGTGVQVAQIIVPRALVMKLWQIPIIGKFLLNITPPCIIFIVIVTAHHSTARDGE